MKHLLPLLLLAGACSEYDLSRESDRNKGKDDDVGTPVEGPQPDIKLSPETISFGYLMVTAPQIRRSSLFRMLAMSPLKSTAQNW